MDCTLQDQKTEAPLAFWEIDNQYDLPGISQVCSEAVNDAIKSTKSGAKEDIGKEAETQKRVSSLCFVSCWTQKIWTPLQQETLTPQILLNSPSNQEVIAAGHCPGCAMNGPLWRTSSSQPCWPPSWPGFPRFETEIPGFSCPVFIKEAKLRRSNKS